MLPPQQHWPKCWVTLLRRIKRKRDRCPGRWLQLSIFPLNTVVKHQTSLHQNTLCKRSIPWICYRWISVTSKTRTKWTGVECELELKLEINWFIRLINSSFIHPTTPRRREWEKRKNKRKEKEKDTQVEEMTYIHVCMCTKNCPRRTERVQLYKMRGKKRKEG